MDHKYKTLLDNVQTRHIITEIVSPDQIIRLRKLDITNFFILGNLESIKNILGEFLFLYFQINSFDRKLKYNYTLESVRPDYFERNFAWHIITQDFGNISVCCGNYSMMLLRPKIYPLSMSNQIQKMVSFLVFSFHNLIPC